MADTNLLILAREFKALRNRVQEVLKMPVGPQGLQGEKGEQGVKGDTGAPGKNGKDGKDGVNGLNGSNGTDGKDGEDGKDGLDGVGVQNAYIDFDNSLVIVLTSGQEINAGFLSQETKDAVVATFKQGGSTLNDLLPLQTGNAGKYLTTDGTNTSWATVTSGSSYTNADVDAHLNTGTATTGEVLSWNGTDYDWITPSTGSVTNVTGTSPVVSSGGTTPAISLAANYGDTQNPYASKTANNFLAAPNGTAGAPTFRALVAADVPTLNQNTTGTAANVTGIVAVANGGSGTSTPSLIAGTNITLTGSWPNQTIAASGGGAIIISNKTAAYTVVASDLGSVINCTSGTFTVSLTAAATLGSGFSVKVWNTSSGASDVITLDPNGTETLDGRSTIILRRGEGVEIVCDGTNFQTGDKKAIRGYAENINPLQSRAVASGDLSIAIGPESTSSGSAGIAFGFNARNASPNGSAIGCNSGANGSQTITGTGAMALGGSYASGTDSFAAASANNTATYGAQGANSIAIGYLAIATALKSAAIGGDTSIASGSNSTAIGGNSLTASGAFSVALGGGSSTASGESSYAFGVRAIAAQVGKIAWGAFSESTLGASQAGMIVLRSDTADATASVLRSNGNAAGGANQLILRNNSAFAFTGTIIARQQAAGGSNFAAWEIKGGIIRDGTAASTTLGSFNINTLSKTAGASAWTIALTADTTNGGLAITVTGAAATNIRWVATVQTSEVTYA